MWQGIAAAKPRNSGNRRHTTSCRARFFRQTINLGGETEELDPDLNQLGGSRTANRLVVTVGKFAVIDIFDTNKYAQ